jgi:hypothetical protein
MYQCDEADLPDGFDVLEESDEEGDGEDHGDTDCICFCFLEF